MKVVLGRDDVAAAALAAIGPTAERVAVKPVHNASKGFVNRGEADIAELAVVTLLQAAAYGKPVLLLPLTLLGRYQHHTLVTMGDLAVEDVAGRSVGVRSWSQTTGVWVRGFLSEQYGVDLRAAEWTTYEEGHIDEYTDPEWVHRAPAGARLPADFLDGRLAFGIMGNELPADDRIRRVVPDADSAGAAWAEDKGFAPVNHLAGVTAEAAGKNAAAVLAAYDAVAELLAATPRGDAPVDLNPVGFEALRGPVSLAARYALEQGVLPRPVEYDELVAATCAALGVPASRLGG